jgi:chromosome segregation ATPase
MSREELRRILERRLEDNKVEFRDMHSDHREEIQRELQYYDEQISAIKSQLSDLSSTIDGLTREIVDQKQLLSDLSDIMKGSAENKRRVKEKNRGNQEETEIIREEDDAIVIVKRR